MKNVVIGAIVGAVVGAGVTGAILTVNKQTTAAMPTSAATKPADASAKAKQKVVYHINYDGGDQDKIYRAAMQNIQNHINAVGIENIDVRVVMHGNGLGVLKNAKSNDALRSQVAGLRNQHVSFAVCENTLKGRKIDYKADLYEVKTEDIVPAGVAEVARLQQMGYAYIKP